MINNNGIIQNKNEVAIDIDNRGFQYGDGLFETLRVINNKVVFWEDHYFRLMASMRVLRMEIPMNFSPEILEEEILKTVAANGLENDAARVKINVYRIAGGFYLPEHREINYFISAKKLENQFYISDHKNYTVELFKDHYQVSGLLSTLKTTTKNIAILGSIYAQENDYDNCFILNEKKMVIEALNSNLFLVNGHEIKTPPLAEGCLNGIIRKKLIEIIEKTEGLTIKEESISPFELQKADELFLTNTIIGIQSVTNYRKKSYSSEKADLLRGKLNTIARLG
ncbi:aminotransferase class IV [Mesonia sp. K7]|uniref:aminotransferase class IV n=1 Tax=Mesonia sp. K7 TaxID=2218606 RepID=UPI000DA6E157|nr:aminotransferase class IV [Mesonia sp. K7]PZD78221.1 aminotransferase class IV [Mesonia sp. K7]